MALGRGSQETVNSPAKKELMNPIIRHLTKIMMWEMYMTLVMWRGRIQSCIYSMIPVLYNMRMEK